MVQEANVVIHFRDLPTDDTVREHLEQRCERLADEFPETTHYELTLQADSGGIEGNCHVRGKKTGVAARIANAETPRQAGDQVLDKVERELRRDHDKRIFTPRRKAQKARSNRVT